MEIYENIIVVQTEDKTGMITTFHMYDFMLVPYTRQTRKGRFTKRAMRYNNNQVAFKDLIQVAMNLYKIKPYEKNVKIKIQCTFKMKKQGNSNNVKNIDVDNMYKSLSDGLQSVMFYNDTQVYEISAEKIDSDKDALIFTIDNYKEESNG